MNDVKSAANDDLLRVLSENPERSVGHGRHSIVADQAGLAATRWLVVNDASQEAVQTLDETNEGPGYRLISRIGAGGMGEVWSALQTSLQRIVAVKRLNARRAERSPSESRLLFEQEALIAAQLNHPNIVPVHDLGVAEDGELLMAMKYVRGTPWNEIIWTDAKTLPLAERLAVHVPVLLSVAQAVAFAHSRGIVHRDLKAEQVIVGQFGEVTLMDWGLAICVDASRLEYVPSEKAIARLPTPENAPSPAGTAVYMAPEQLRDSARDIGFHTDVYLLGAILHYLLTGRPLRQGLHGVDLLDAISEGRYHEIPEGMEPAELVELAVLSLKPQAADRLPSAMDFVHRLQEYLSGSRRREEAQVLVAEARRRMAEQAPANYHEATETLNALHKAENLWPANEATAKLGDEVLASLVRMAIANDDLMLAQVQLERIGDERLRRDAGGELAAALRRARRRELVRQVALRTCFLLLAMIALISVLFNSRLTKRTREAEEASLRAQDATAQAVEAGTRLESQLYRSSVALAERLLNSGSPHLARARLLATDPEHRDIEWALLYRLATPELFSRDLEAGPLLGMFHSTQTGELEVFSESSLTLFDPENGTTQPVASDVVAVAHTKAEDMRGILRGDGMVLISGRMTAEFPAAVSEPAQLQFLARGDGVIVTDGLRVARQAFSGAVEWEVTLSETLTVLGPPSEEDVLPVGLASGDIILLDAAGNNVQTLAGHAGKIHSLRRSEEGLLVSSSFDGTARVWDLDNAEAAQTVHASEEVQLLGAVNAALLSESLGLLFTGGEDGRVRMWLHGSSISVGELPRHPAAVTDLLLLPGGDLIATTARDGVLRLWDVRPTHSETLPGHTGRIVARGSTEDGRFAVTMAHDNTARLWDMESLDIVSTFEPPMQQYSYCEGRITPDGRRLAVGTRANVVYLYDVRSGEALHSFDTGFDLDDVALSPDGRWIASGSHFGNVLVCDVDEKRLTRVAGLPEENIMTLEFTPDGRTLVVCPYDGTVQLVDPVTATIRDSFEAHPGSWVERVAFSRDGRRVATAGFDGVLRLWELESHRKTAEFHGHDSWISDVRFSASEQRLVTSSADGTIRVWSVPDQVEVLRLHPAGGRVDSLTLGPEDGWMVATFSSKDPEVWRLPAIDRAEPLRRVAEWEEKRLRSVAAAGEIRHTKEPNVIAEMVLPHLQEIQAPLFDYRASVDDVTRGRTLRIVVLMRLPVEEGRGIYITGNRPEIGTWVPNMVPLQHVADVEGGSLWQYVVPFRPMEFKLTLGERREDWGETHEWGGPPNREIGFRTPLMIDRKGTLVLFAEFGQRPEGP